MFLNSPPLRSPLDIFAFLAWSQKSKRALSFMLYWPAKDSIQFLLSQSGLSGSSLRETRDDTCVNCELQVQIQGRRTIQVLVYSYANEFEIGRNFEMHTRHKTACMFIKMFGITKMRVIFQPALLNQVEGGLHDPERRGKIINQGKKKEMVPHQVSHQTNSDFFPELAPG